MTIKDIVSVALEYIGMGEKRKLLSSGTLSGSDGALIDKLVRLTNLALAEIAEDYFPLEIKDVYSDCGGMISYKDFYFPLKKIIYLRDRAGRDLPYTFGLSGVMFDSNYAKILYSGTPCNLALNDDCLYEDHTISREVIAYLVAYNYWTVAGDYQSGNIYRNKFDEYMLSHKKKQGLKLPRRKWV